MRFLRNARTRLMIASALFGAASIGIVLILVYWNANRIIQAETQRVVTAELAGLADSYDTLGVLGLRRAIDRRIRSLDDPEAVYLLTDAFGGVIAGNLGAWPPTIRPGTGWVELELIRSDTGAAVPISAASLRLPGGERLLVGRDGSAQNRFSRVWVQSLGLGLGVAVILSIVMAWLLSRLVFTRLAAISGTARDIIDGDLSRRIPVRNTGDEVDDLSTTLNDMLDRIHELVANLRMTTDSFSHDLRSPLTRLKSRIETLARTGLPPEVQAQEAERANAEIDHLLAIFADLTEISRADARIGRDNFETVDISALAREVADLYAPLAEDRGIDLVAEGPPARTPGNRRLLMRALVNLVENALRYAPGDSTIRITTAIDDMIDGASDGARVRLSVADAGPGVPEDALVRIFQPFVTLDAARSGGTSGLGLALVAAIARLHNGRARASNLSPGLEVTLDLPAAASGG
ncbi:MAG: sensor histidine kinase [Marinibacterium sp.]